MIRTKADAMYQILAEAEDYCSQHLEKPGKSCSNCPYSYGEKEECVLDYLITVQRELDAEEQYDGN